MIRALYSAANGMIAQQFSMDVTANNLANAATTGYKRDRAEFADLIYQELRPATAERPGVQVGQGARLAAVQRLYTQGPVQATERELDVAIAGAGFLPVQGTDGGTLYTRAGNLQLNRDRVLVTEDGRPVLTADGPLTVPAGAGHLQIDPNGAVRWVDPAADAPRDLGQLQLALFPNPQGLAAAGDNLLAATAAAGPAQMVAPGRDGAGEVRQGFLEGANVEVVTEMVNLITAQRVYEMTSKALQGADDMLAMANQLRR